MVDVSCSGKFHAFALAEQMEKNGMLDNFYTTYAYQKNILLRKLVRRTDKENIPISKIRTNTFLAFPIKLLPGSGYFWLDLFDRWVARKIRKRNSKIFIGWSGMSLHSIRAAKASGKITILERGSSHILYQNQILQDEYKNFGFNFSIDSRIITKELNEYEEADYISIPSLFVKNSFIEQGVKEEKLIMNPYGVSNFFNAPLKSTNKNKFTILYLGTLSIRKGLKYLFEALNILKINSNEFEVWFVGKVDKELVEIVDSSKKHNWKFFGHINHYDLQKYITQCDVAVHPSLEEGLSMVIPQLLKCGIPVIATKNTGGENIINEGKNGFIVPIRSPERIAEKINYLYNNLKILDQMKIDAAYSQNSSWDDYGKRYIDFLKSI